MAIILEEIYEVALHRYNMKLVAGGRGLRNLVDWVSRRWIMSLF